MLQLGPLVNQMMPIVEAFPVYSMARNASGELHQILALVMLIWSGTFYSFAIGWYIS